MKTSTWNRFPARALCLPFLSALVLALAGPSFADPPLPVIPATNFNITSFGAFGDGVSNNATAIQNAINAASAAGGGTVVVAAVGILTNYLSGPVNLSNSVCLQVNSGTKLQMLPYASWPSNTTFINGTGLHDVEINGSGTIDGNAGFTVGFVTNWWGLATTNAPVANRPNFINFSGCSNILIQGVTPQNPVTLQNPPTFHIMAKGNNVNLTIQNMTESTIGTSHNTDGMDIGSSNVLVRNCNISVGDDNIEIGGSTAAVGNMTVSNCTFGTGHGVSLGSLVNGAGGGVQNLIVSNCTFDGTDYGIRMKSDRDRGGLCQNLQYLDITMTNVDYPIVIYSYYNSVGTPNNISPFRASTDTVHTITGTTPIWRNITISNLTATGLTGDNIAGIIWGVPEMLVSNITLYNVNISAPTNTFDIYNARDIRIVNSQIATPSSTNSFTLYNAEVIITNSVANTNLVKLGGLAAPPTNNTFALFNTQAAITETNVLGAGPITLGGSTLTFTNSAVSFSNSISVASASTLVLTNGNNTFGGALTGPGPLSLILTNGANLRFDQGANVWGGSNTAFDASASGIINNHSAGNISIFLGALSGGSGSRLQGSDQPGPAVDTYVIGSLNSNTTFAGVITNGTSGGTPHTVALTKTGTGTFTLSNTNSYTGGTTVSNGTLLVTGTAGQGTLTVAGGVVAMTGPLNVGVSGTSTVKVVSGLLAITNTPATVSGGSGFVIDGSVTLTNGSSILVSNGSTVVGNAGSGSLTVQSGSMLVSNLIVGNLTGSRGTITFAGGTNQTANATSIGLGTGSTGTVWITGGLVNPTNAFIFVVGTVGSGQLTLSNGTFRSSLVTVGGTGGSVGTLTVAGGTWDGPGALSVGDVSNARGTVWITGGAVVLTNNSFNNVLGNGGLGSLTVSNGVVSARQLNLGVGAGAGTLTMAGGTNSVYTGMTLGNSVCTATGTVIVAGGRLFVTNATATAVLDVRGGSVTLNSGTLTINSLVITNACGRFFKTGGTLSITTTNLGASLDADGDGFTNQQETNAGTNPFDPASTPTVTSWNTASSGKWEVDGNWSGGAPSALFQAAFITNATTKTVTIDATTTNMASTLTISNLTVSAPVSSTNTLSLSNAGFGTPLNILNVLTIADRGILLLTNSALIAGRLVATNSTAVIQFPAGTMTLRGAVVANSQDFLIGAAGQIATLNVPAGSNSFANGFSLGPVANSTGIVWITDGQLTATNSDTYVGSNGVGQVTISNGTWRTRATAVGWNPGSRGTLTIAGGTNVLSSILMLVGFFPDATGDVWVTGGHLVATNNGAINIAGYGVGQMTLSNGTCRASAMFLGNGAGGRGTLTVAGGTNALNGELVIGASTGATGTMWMTGGQLTNTNLDTEVGRNGIGQMTVSNGNWLARGVVVGRNAGSRGTLTIDGGTNLFSSDFSIGLFAGSTGAVWVTGGLLTITNGSTVVGYSDIGQMTVSNGTWLSRNIAVAFDAGSRGTLTTAGGTSSVYSNLTLGTSDCTATGIVNVVGGQLFVTNSVTNATLEVRSGTLTLSSGTLVIDRLVITNACGRFIHTGGTLSITTTNLDPNLSAVGDGISNGWKQQYGLDPFDPSVANEDPDGDGLTNAEEYSLGTDPTKNDFRITAIAREGNDIRITWATYGGATNRVLVSAGTANGSYTNNFSNLSPLILVPGAGATSTNYLDVAGATNTPARYYRVRQGAGTQGARFLFDAGHAQSAGNADWVIDADLHNITWNNTGTFTVSGSDSNAQRIPTPAASGIISNTAETYWQGGISAWAVDLVKRGHSVETLPAGATFTYNTANTQDLTNYNVVVVDEPNILFTLAEKQALLSFVSNGGSLFMIGDHVVSDRDGDGQDSVSVWNDFLTNNLVTNNPFGIIFRSTGAGSNGSGSNTFSRSLVGNPILNGPVGVATNLEFFNGNEFQIDNTKNPTAVSHLWFGTLGDSNNFCGLAALQYGNGRVVVVGDSSCIEDGTGDPGDGLFNGYTLDTGGVQHIWILNASEWLAAPFQ